MAFVDLDTTGNENHFSLIGKIRDMLVETYAHIFWSGWAVYNDTEYTSGSPFQLAGNSTQVTLPNNAGSKIESRLPADVPTFYDDVNQKITGRNAAMNFALALALSQLNTPHVPATYPAGRALPINGTSPPPIVSSLTIATFDQVPLPSLIVSRISP